MLPETRYARDGDLHIAYQVLGDGPRDIALVDQWFTHVDGQWDLPPLAAIRRRLASFSRLITFDKRGTGASDPVAANALPSLEQWMDDLRIVLDAVGSQRAVPVANIAGGLMAILFAAAHPDRTSALVLVDCFPRYLNAPDYEIGDTPAELERSIEQVESQIGRGVMLDILAPSAATQPGLRDAWARFERQSVSPRSATAILRMIFESDVRDVLPAVQAPTLVINRSPGARVTAPQGRYIAERIPNARFVELPGRDNLMWAGDQDAVVDEIEEFLTGIRPTPETDRVLATVLFTDIVDSTARAGRLGDARWRALLAEHDRVVRRELDRFGGREIKTIGDGFLATFDGPARAIRAADTIRSGVHVLDLQVRAGLHTGEVVVLQDDVAGMAVNIGARVAGLAGPDEVLVSSTVKDLVAGSGIAFEDRGTRTLKGVPDEWRIFAVVSGMRP